MIDFIKRILRKDAKKFDSLPFKSIGFGATVMDTYLIKNPQYMEIGKNFSALFNLRLEAWDEYLDQKFSPKIIIGDNVCFNSDVHIGCIDRIEIGNNVLMASRIFIADSSHGEITSEGIKVPPLKRPLFSKGPVIIEDNVWIGEGVCILSGVKIGKNAIIGANSVVNRDVPENAVVGGIPFRVLKML